MITAPVDSSFEAENILQPDQIVTRIRELQADGKIVGLCHGGFDLLHPGHVQHFESAKKLCDVLIVSVTADRFVQERKGKNRPILNQQLRAYMISRLKAVDFVTISDYQRGVEIIDFLRPDLYIKGPDYIHKKSPGITAERQAITDVGGKIAYTKQEKMSSTDILEHIKNLLHEE